jgi:serine protease Do
VGGDIIVGVNGKAVNSAEELSSAIGSKKAGEKISIEIWRATGSGTYSKKTVSVTLTSRPNSIKNPDTPEG